MAQILIYNISMKKSVLLTTLVPCLALLPAITTSCSSNNNNNDSTTNFQTIVDQEIKRIEQLKNQLSLKITGDLTEEKIELLNANNILDNLNNWTVGQIANRPQEKFTYLIEEFDNGLKQSNDQKTLSFFIKVSYQNVSQRTSKIEIQYQLKTDNPPVPDIPADQLFNPEGGLIANTKLQTSAYKNLISSLNLLNDKTYLPNLNDKILMETLQKRPEFKGLSLNIEAGSETLNGTLNLQLKSQTKQQIIEPTTIKITGFQTYSLTNNDPLQYHSFQVDSKRWFDEKLPISTTTNLTNAIQQISNNQWNQVLEDFRVLSANNASQNFGNAKELKANGFNFEIKSVYDNATSQIKLTITTKFTHKKYENQNWIATNQVSVWNQASNTNSVIELFTKENLQQFIVDQTKINEDELATKTPSYYLGKAYYYKSINTEFNNDQDLFENSYLTNNDFTEFYFDRSTNLSLSFSQDSISANDWNNTLSFSVGLVVNDKIVNQSQPFEFNNKNKAISTILKDKLETNRSQIQPSSNLKKRVIQHLKQNHKDDVDQLFANGAQQESKTFDDFPGSSISSQLTQSLLKDNYEQTNNVWEKVKEEIDVALFKEPGINLTDGSFEYQNNHTLNFPSRLFWLSRDDVFVIEQIKYQFSQPNVSIKLTKQGNFISVDLQGETVIDFASSEEKTVPTNFFFNLFNTDWPKN